MWLSIFLRERRQFFARYGNPTTHTRGVTMKYALLIYGEESTWADMSEAEMRRIYSEHEAYGNALAKAGALCGGSELAPSTQATTIRFANGKHNLTDGPFAETREQLGGFYLIDVDDLDEALAWARRMPAMTSGAVEVRPLGMGEG
jgi:hypothetical protein